MTGPEHYAEAERLARKVATTVNLPVVAAVLVARAQLHATLALAAATDPGVTPGTA